MFQHVKRGEAVLSTDFPTMRYSDRDKCFVVTLYDSKTKTREYRKIDERIVLDFGNAKHGQERLQRGMKYDIIAAPITEPLPEKPDDNYQPVGILRCVVPSIGYVNLIVDFDPVADLLSNVYERYVASVEATKDQIPVVEFSDMNMEFVDWIDREKKYFGKRLVPLPGLKRDDRIPAHRGLNGQSYTSV